jgi:cytochrome c peroxidase
MSAYVASLTSFDSAFDKMIRNETNDLDADVINGFNLFMGKAACATCHFPPTFSGLLPPEYSESESEVLGVPSTPQAPFEIDPDPGRYMNHLLKEQATFYKHAFKTPTARNIIRTAPYMHNGVYNSIEELIEFYDAGGGIGLGINVPNQTLPGDSLHLTENEKLNLKLFLESLEDNPFDIKE